MRDSVYQQFATGEEVRGIEDNVRIAKARHNGFPDANGEIVNAFESGDQAVLQIFWTGTHTGNLVGPGGVSHRPEGRCDPVCRIVTVRDGKVARTDHYFDMLTLLTQPGVAPVAADVP